MKILTCGYNTNYSNRTNINTGGGAYPPALHQAAFKHKDDVVKLLLDPGADANAKSGTYNTALSATAYGGFVDIIDVLLKAEADPRKPCGHFSNTLTAALFSFSFDLIYDLVETGVDINESDVQGRTSMHIAAYIGEWETFSRLIEKIQRL